MNLFDLLTNEEKKSLKTECFSKGETIFYEGEKCQKIGILINGELKISTFTPSGKEIIFNIIRKDEIFGNNLIFSTSPYYKGYVVAQRKSEVAFLNKNQLFAILKNNSAFLITFLNIQSDFSKKEKLTIELLSIQSAKERFLFFLKENNQTYTYKSISTLAVSLNMKRETLSRTINSLIKDKIITRSNKTIFLK